MARIQEIKGKTGCLFLKRNSIPFYSITKKEWLLMDSGAASDREELFSFLKEHGIIVRAVLCSHAHFDHVENCRILQETFGAEIIMSAFDAGAVRDEVSLKSCFYSHTAQENKNVNGEMILRADKIFCQDTGYVSVSGEIFKIIPLPGHAASHIGFVTPDDVAYLADSLFGYKELEAGGLIYMLSWKEAMETIKNLKESCYESFILAHSGVYQNIKEIAEKNVDHLETLLGEVYGLFDHGLTLEQLVGRVVHHYGYHVKNIEKAKLFERIVRAMTEALLEDGRLGMELADGRILYVPKSETACWNRPFR